MANVEIFNQYVEANKGLRQAVIDALATFFWSLDTSNSNEVIKALEEFIPQLIDQYGDVATVLAADYFDMMRAEAGVAPLYKTVLSKADIEDLGPSIGWAAQGLYQEGLTPVDTLDRLTKVVDVRVKEAGTNTLLTNIDRDPAKPLYARVPVGKTCEFCRLLGSRGFAYTSEHSAKFGADGKKFHDACDCQIVAEWDTKNPSLAGYDPDKYLDEYNEALKYTEGSDIKDVLAGYRKAAAEKSGSTTPTPSKPKKKDVWDDPAWIEHQIAVTTPMKDSEWRTSFLEKLKKRQSVLSVAA